MNLLSITPIHIDEISKNTNIPINVLLSVVCKLEIKGYISIDSDLYIHTI